MSNRAVFTAQMVVMKRPHFRYDGAEREWRLELWDEVVYGSDMASTVPDHHQRQGPLGEGPAGEPESPTDARPQGS